MNMPLSSSLIPIPELSKLKTFHMYSTFSHLKDDEDVAYNVVTMIRATEKKRE